MPLHPASPKHPAFRYETTTPWYHGENDPTSEATLSAIVEWWRPDDLFNSTRPADFFAEHGHVQLRICPGDGTDYQMFVCATGGAALPGGPVVGIGFYNTYRSTALLGRVDLNTGNGPWLYAHEVGYVSALLRIPEQQINGGVCAAGHVATLIAALACRVTRGLR